MEWSILRDEVARRAIAVGDLLRAAPDATAPVRGLDWNVGELAAHLVSVPRRYLRMLESGMPFPESLAALNQADVDAVASRDPATLASMLDAGVTELLGVLGDDGTRPVPFFGIEHTVMGMAGVLLGELCLHGLDLARTLGRSWRIDRDDALVIVDGLLPSLVGSADPAVTRTTSGTFALRLRGGADWTIAVAGDDVTITRGRPAHADLTVSADPRAFLLVGFARTPRWRAIATGGMVAWGRKPWLAGRFGRLFAET